MKEILETLLKHLDVVELLIQALTGGVSKDELKKKINETLTQKQLEESDKRMREEIG
jgi:hypothetical protein